ncbi:sorting nexin-33-like [Macrobrachium nipponense]|uniref:sorting nexin-33-like n=1 Tax=Macrobrachium nipponense TaxID=159736 RepID=UPI0030C84891
MLKATLRCRVCEDEIKIRPSTNLICGHFLCIECIDQMVPATSDVRCPDCHDLFVARESSSIRLSFPSISFSYPLLSPEFQDAVQHVSSRTSKNSLENYTKINSIYIDDYGQGPFWRIFSAEYTCQITSLKSQQSSYGVRHHITYAVLPSFSTNQVLRTYGDFESLFIDFSVTYPFVVTPPLPGKQLIGSCTEEFIEKQRSLLQSWIDRICRHPVLSQSKIFQQFITASNEKPWKDSNEDRNTQKPTIECLFNGIKLQNSSEVADIPQIVREQELFISTLNKELVYFHNICRIIANGYRNAYKQEYDNLSFAFQKFSEALVTERSNLSIIMHHLSKAYLDIGNIFETVDGKDWRSLENLFLEYQSLLDGLNKSCCFASRTLSQCRPSPHDENFTLKAHTFQNNSEETNISSDSSPRAEESKVVVYALQAEISHFHQQITRDFGTAIKTFIVDQIHLYQRITERLRRGLERIISGDEENSASSFGI